MVTTVGAQEHVRLTQPPQTGPVSVEMNSFGQAKSSSIRYVPGVRPVMTSG